MLSQMVCISLVKRSITWLVETVRLPLPLAWLSASSVCMVRLSWRGELVLPMISAGVSPSETRVSGESRLSRAAAKPVLDWARATQLSTKAWRLIVSPSDENRRWLPESTSELI